MTVQYLARVAALGALLSGALLADGNAGSFSASVIGSAPNLTIGGVSSAGAAWTVSQSDASLSVTGAGQGQLQVQLQGLLLADGTTGSVHAVAASIVCGGSGGMVVSNSAAVALDSGGNAQIQSAVRLPAVCRAPVILVRVFDASAPQGSRLGSFIASTGLVARTNGNGQSDNGN